MGSDVAVPEVVVWTDSVSAGLAGRVLATLGASVEVVGVGGPRSSRVWELAEQFRAPALDDFRKLLQDRPPSYPRDFNRQVPAEGGAHDILVADRDADQRESGRPAAERPVVVAEGRCAAPCLRRLTGLWHEVVKNVG